MAFIEAKELTRFYGSQKAVDNISFQLEPGEIVGFLGPNGAGKSTTMKILTGGLRPTSGQAFIRGIDVRQDPIAAKKITGYLPESNPLYPEMYVREYLGFVADIHGLKEKKSVVEDVIGRVGLTPEAGKKIQQLSKGYKQRVGLAAALMHEPDVLILDEPTTGLDPNQILEIRDVIRQYGKTHCVLFSSHILQEVEAICDRVIIIQQGRLIADGTLAALRKENAGQRVRIVLQETVGENAWDGLPGLISATRANEKEWQFETADPEKLKKQLLAHALRNNWNLVSLQSENRSLQDIFRGLTKLPQS